MWSASVFDEKPEGSCIEMLLKVNQALLSLLADRVCWDWLILQGQLISSNV